MQEVARAQLWLLRLSLNKPLVFSELSTGSPLAEKLLSQLMPEVVGQRSERHLLNWTGEDAGAKPKHSMLPLLTVLFLVAYCMMTMLIVEQARTIETQRTLILQLFKDSVELSALKGKEVQKRYADSQAAKTQAQKQAPSSQAKQRDSQAQTPSSQVTPQANAKNERQAGKLRKPAPLKPPRDASDEADERRSVNSI